LNKGLKFQKETPVKVEVKSTLIGGFSFWIDEDFFIK